MRAPRPRVSERPQRWMTAVCPSCKVPCSRKVGLRACRKRPPGRHSTHSRQTQHWLQRALNGHSLRSDLMTAMPAKAAVSSTTAFKDLPNYRSAERSARRPLCVKGSERPVTYLASCNNAGRPKNRLPICAWAARNYSSSRSSNSSSLGPV